MGYQLSRSLDFGEVLLHWGCIYWRWDYFRWIRLFHNIRGTFSSETLQKTINLPTMHCQRQVSSDDVFGI